MYSVLKTHNPLRRNKPHVDSFTGYETCHTSLSQTIQKVLTSPPCSSLSVCTLSTTNHIITVRSDESRQLVLTKGSRFLNCQLNYIRR